MPPLRCEVSEHQMLEAQCRCGKVHRGAFPAAVPVQYRACSNAAVVQLTHHYMLSLARTGEFMGDRFGLPMSDPTELAIQAEGQVLLVPTVAAMSEAITRVPVAYTEENGMYVAGKPYCIPPLLMWLGALPNRAKTSFDAFGLMIVFAGTLIYDGWKPYQELACKRGLCKVHHVRELTYVLGQMGRT